MKDNLVFKKVFGISFDDRPVRNCEWKELHAERSRLKKAMESLIERCELDQRNLTEDEEKAWKLGETIIDAINKEMEERSELGNRAARPFQGGGRGKEGSSQPADDIPGLGTVGLASLFQGRTNRGGFETFDQFVRAVAGIGEQRTALSAVGEAGGYAVPEFWESRFMHQVNDVAAVVRYCSTLLMPGNTVHIPMFNLWDRAAGEYAAVTADWLGEGEVFSEQTPKLVEANLYAKKLIVATSASREILADGLDFGRQIGQVLVRAVAGALDSAILAGNGIGKPLGLLNGTGTITVSRTTANTITYSDVTALLSRIWPPLLGNVIFLCSPTAFLKLLQLKDDTSALIWPINGGSVAGEIPLTLLGKRLIVTDRLPELGARGDLVCANMSQYLLGIREGTTLESTNAYRWSEDLVSFRCVMRCDGLPLWGRTVKPANGTTELGWAAILE